MTILRPIGSDGYLAAYEYAKDAQFATDDRDLNASRFANWYGNQTAPIFKSIPVAWNYWWQEVATK